jgi:Arc/MetJ-type ribon-helix-helix transcriptional regulator
MPFSIRFDSETESMIDRLARESGRSRSSVVREAVVRYASTVNSEKSAYEWLKPLIGAIRSGRTDGSQHTGRKFGALLKRQRAKHARRSR